MELKLQINGKCQWEFQKKPRKWLKTVVFKIWEWFPMGVFLPLGVPMGVDGAPSGAQRGLNGKSIGKYHRLMSDNLCTAKS